MEEKTSGIVLSGVGYGENDKIVNIFTLDKGVVSARMKGVKKAGAKLKFASEPFCFAEYVFSLGRTGRTVIGASLIDSFYPLRLDVKKLYSASTVLAFVKKFCRENIDTSDVFFLTVDALKKIAYTDAHFIDYLVEFLLKALACSGYAINLKGCFGCGCELTDKVYFDYRTGGFYCEDCFNGQGREVLLETYFVLKNAIEGNTSEEKSVVKGLKLIEYFLENRVDVTLEPLKELLKIYSL